MNTTLNLCTALMMATAMSAVAGENFGGIHFDSSIPASQMQVIKEDLIYLYRNPIKDVDSSLQSMAGLPKIDGHHLYNWIYNRVKYIIGEDYKISDKNLVKQTGFQFPATPLPPMILNGTNQYSNVLVMSNAGAELYVTGKRDKVLKGLRIDNKVVFATSPRTGILQIGEGLFMDKHLVNSGLYAEANKIQRLGTFFHEARHADGHSEHIGFIHSRCPKGHNLSGVYACEAYANGAYSLEAVATKTLMLNCKTCSETDRTKLMAAIADAYSRVVVRSHLKTEQQLLEEMTSYQGVIDFYVNYIAANPKIGQAYVEELNRLKSQLRESQRQLQELRTPIEPKKFDAVPEGSFEEAPVEKSTKLMNASLVK